MPTSIGEPWPPADPTQPLDYDHRGCCQPKSPCTRWQALELRYDVIGVRDAGPVGVGWLWIATGQLMIAQAGDWHWENAHATGAVGLLILENHLHLLPSADTLGHMAATADLFISLLPGIRINAETDNADAYCEGAFEMPVTFANGPPDPPDRIRVIPLRWYDTSSFPWLG